MTRDEVHALILSFPEVEEGVSWNTPTYKAFGKWFTRIRDEDASVVIQEVPHEERDFLIEADPDTFFFTDHYKSWPIVLARYAEIEPDQLRGFLTRKWRKAAPKKWLKAWEAGAGSAS
jgi:hypothetical protein